VSGATPTAAGPPPQPNPNGYAAISGISDHARQIYAQGRQMGNRANVFSKVGDSITVSPVFLGPIGSGYYNLHVYAGLQPVIDFYSAQPARGEANSFSNPSLAATSYIVVAGDTIWSIAQRFGVPLQRLIDANPTIDPNLLHAGDVLRIPGPKDVVPTLANAAARLLVDGGVLRLRSTLTLAGVVLGYRDAP